MNVKNIGIALALSLLLTLFSVSAVRAEGEDASLGGLIPRTEEENDIPPAVVDTGAGVIIDPANGGTTDITGPSEPGNGGGTTIVPPTDEQNHFDPGIPATPTPSPSPIIFGGSSSSSGSRSVVLTPILISATTTPGSCIYLNDYLRFGRNNNPAEVYKLQLFLKNVENLNVDANGTFDSKTLDAVEAFQAKYLNDIMIPWGSSNPTGQVYFTTRKKINEIYCKSSFALTSAQLAQIEVYKNGVADGTIQVDSDGTIQVDSNGNLIEVTSTSSTSTSPELGSNGDVDNSQTAAVGNVGFFGKIWNFVKWLFGY